MILFYLSYQYFICCDAEVWIDHKFFSCKWTGLVEFGGQEYADTGQELELTFLYLDNWQKSIKVVDCQGKYLWMARLFLSHIQHPRDNNFPHVWLDVRLDCVEIVWSAGMVAHTVKNVGKNPVVIDQGRVCKRLKPINWKVIVCFTKICCFLASQIHVCFNDIKFKQEKDDDLFFTLFFDKKFSFLSSSLFPPKKCLNVWSLLAACWSLTERV